MTNIPRALTAEEMEQLRCLNRSPSTFAFVRLAYVEQQFAEAKRLMRCYEYDPEMDVTAAFRAFLSAVDHA